MNLAAVKERFPLLKWLLKAERIPLLFSVTIVSGIFYHYAPELTVLWIVLSLLLQTPLFRLFDFMKKHSIIGGAIYCVVGLIFLGVSVMFVLLGLDAPLFAPESDAYQMDFMIWFLTPQSVLAADYLGYTIALFLLFTIFIASVAYYFTLVRYRVLMSFVVMIFPFAIYAKENESMPVPSIIILLVCYFAVMVYCRQAHAEDPEVVQRYAPNAESRLSMPSKKSPHAGVKPEFLDGSFLRATGIFIAASIILVLMIPKPAVAADRTYLDNMLDMSWLTDKLMETIEGFTDTSDGGDYSSQTYSRTLYFAAANEPLNLRIRTLTDYHYSSDSWSSSEQDAKPDPDTEYREADGFRTIAEEPDPTLLLAAIRAAAKADPDFAKRWDIQSLPETPPSSVFYYPLEIQFASSPYNIYPAPTKVTHMEQDLFNGSARTMEIMQNMSGILFSNYVSRYSQASYSLRYVSQTFADTAAEQKLFSTFDLVSWELFLPDLMRTAERAGQDTEQIELAVRSLEHAREYAACVHSETPLQVHELAEALTAECITDYEKATAICDYLKNSGEYLYSLNFPITDADNVLTFLMQNKTGVCYQFASAMSELCRSAGVITRYVEGYAMTEPDNRLIGGGDWDYAITTEHGHAFTEVYIPGYGWMMMDATAPDLLATGSRRKTNVLSTLQFSGVMLFFIAVAVLLAVFWLFPMLREMLFRKKCRKLRNAEAVQAAFARLRKQWKADPAETARTLCEKQSAFLQTDLSDLLESFEQTVYANRCTPEAADRAYSCYCRACDAYKPAVRRQRKAEKAARRAARQAAVGKA